MSMEGFDVLRALHESGVDDVAAMIFNYLDKESLKCAEDASPLWKHVIVQWKLWHKLLKKDLFQDPRKQRFQKVLMAQPSYALDTEEISNISSLTARKLCFEIGKEMQILDENWNSGYFTRLSHDFGPQFRGNTDNNDVFDMNEAYIVRGQPDRRIIVRDRWNLKTVKVLELPIVQIRHTGWVPTFRSVKINTNFVVVSFNNHSEICVWDSRTFELIRVLDGEYGETEDGTRLLDEDVNYVSYGHALWDELLFTCHANMSNGSCICRLRKLSRDLDGEITTLFVSEIPGPIVNFWDLSMDDKYVLLFYSRKEEVGVARSRIEVRNATTFDLDATILFRSDVFYHFHYFNGIAVTAQTGKFIRFWDVRTGLRLRNIPLSHTLSCIRIISKKYFVTCDAIGKVQIFDFERTLKDITAPWSKLLVTYIDSPQQPFHERSVDAVMQVDEFQVVVVLQFDRSSSHAYVYQFLGKVPYEEQKKRLRVKSLLQRRNL